MRWERHNAVGMYIHNATVYIGASECESALTGILPTGLVPFLFSSAMHLLTHIGWFRPPGEYLLRQRRARICCRGLSCMSSSRHVQGWTCLRRGSLCSQSSYHSLLGRGQTGGGQLGPTPRRREEKRKENRGQRER